MPKVKPSRERQRQLNITAEINAAITKSGLDKETVAKRTGIPYSTLCAHINNPWRMNLSELDRIGRVTGLKFEIEAPAYNTE